jgi:tRNA threonylcarbamoyladenosine dehydratase
MSAIEKLIASTDRLKFVHQPLLMRLNNAADKQTFEELVSCEEVSFASDLIYSQLKELIKSRNPTISIKPEEYDFLINTHLAGENIHDYGVWVYYPWSRSLVHLLDEEEFVELRTSRNQHKITRAESDILSKKKIGIVGLSVGHSIALTLATERGCGELRLADFDQLELSNLNRIRSGVQNLGVPKVIIAAREISEIDPFLKVIVFTEGLHKDNMDEFFCGKGNLDLFVEVCDGLDIKIQSRYKAKALNIPVVMDTNDRGMLDVERFDIEPDRSIFHGKIDAYLPDFTSNPKDETLRMQILMALVSFDTLSERMKYSMKQIGKTITTWPQLASSVVLGGAITTDISRRILLNEHTVSGRYYVDLDEIFDSRSKN